MNDRFCRGGAWLALAFGLSVSISAVAAETAAVTPVAPPAPTATPAITIHVGIVPIALPMPSGFGLVTPEMTAIYASQAAFVPEASEQLASMIPQDAVPEALQGGMPAFDRWMIVHVLKTLRDRPLSAADFAEFRKVMRTQTQQVAAAANKELPDLLDQASENLSEQIDEEVEISADGMVVLPPHVDTDSTLAISMRMNVHGEGADGVSIDDSITATMVTVRVRDRLLSLYIYGARGDLEWTRQAGREWSEAVLAANR